MKKKEASPKRIPSAPRKMGSFELCASLSAIAAFPVEDKDSQMKIYEAIKRLQLLEKALLPHDPPDGGQGRANTPRPPQPQKKPRPSGARSRLRRRRFSRAKPARQCRSAMLAVSRRSYYHRPPLALARSRAGPSAPSATSPRSTETVTSTPIACPSA
jgi:hypothetical protein